MNELGSARPPATQRLILRNHQSPGDILMLTAAVRDLHRCYPGRFETDVRTACPALWENNPYLTPIDDDDSTARVVECHYPLIHRSNSAGKHFLWGFVEYLNEVLGLSIQLTEFRGDVHLSPPEQSRPSVVKRLAGIGLPYWIVVAGGKYDFTVKWWSTDRYQAVIDHFRDRLLFVQVGEFGHHHPALTGVLDLRGRTTLRDLIALMHHADGVLCPVTFMMHLAAAVPASDPRARTRPCVVVAGGREPLNWEQYPHHQFMHTVGALWCCRDGGCWRSRTAPLGDGSENDRSDRLCVDVVGKLPRCMDLIEPAEVAQHIEYYIAGRVARELDGAEQARVRRLVSRAGTKVSVNGFTPAKPEDTQSPLAASLQMERSPDQVVRVLYLLAGNQLGGSERLALNLCLARPESCVGVVAFVDGPATGWFASRGVRVFQYWKARDSVRLQRELQRMLAVTDLVNVVCCCSYENGFQFLQLAELPSVVSLQCRTKLPLMRAPIICPTDEVAKLQAHENLCHVIANGVDTVEFSRAGTPVKHARCALRLLSVGRVDKFEDYAAQIMLHLGQKHHGVRLVMVGSHSARTRFVVSVGTRRNIKPFLARSGILLHCPPTGTGAQDFAVLEAMSMGVVPVAADTPGTRTSVRDGEDGFLVEPGDMDGFVSRIDLLIRDRVRWEAMSAAAARRVRDEFSASTMAAAYEVVYRRALEEWKTRLQELPVG